jgi:MoaA/NifB/PqqE/SkfB family radical SAM enzyme
LAAAGLILAGVSLDGARRDTHDGLRGEGAYQQALAGIEALHAAQIPVTLQVTLTRFNAYQALEFIPLAQQLGVQAISYSAVVPLGRARRQSQLMLDRTTWGEVNQALYEARLTAQVQITPTCAMAGACVACVEPNITCDGWVTPCYLSAEKLFPVLEVTPDELRVKLAQLRGPQVDGCGRRAWVPMVSALPAYL